MNSLTGCLLTLMLAAVQCQHAFPAIDNTTGIDEQKLVLEDKKYHEDLASSLSSWIKEQIQYLPEIKEFASFQSFVLPLTPSHSHEFRWTPNAHSKQFKILLSVYSQNNGEEFSYHTNPEEDDFIMVQRKSHLNDQYQSLGKVYISKIFTLSFPTKSQIIRLTSYHDSTLAIEVDLEGEDLTINPYVEVKNDDFVIPTTKMEAIYSEMKVTEANRNRVFKWSWGFLERQEHYESQMLKLTGVQLLIILATAVVQMYCIRNLFDRQQII